MAHLDLELNALVGILLSDFLAERYSSKISILTATGVFVIVVVVQATAGAAGHPSILGEGLVT